MSAHTTGGVRDGWRLLRTGFRGQRAAITSVLVWSIIEALPALAMGPALAQALDRGFLAGEPQVGFVWLGALLVLMLISAVATRMVYPRLAAVIEPLRDHLVEHVVNASLHQTGDREARADSAVVSRLTEQVETTRRLMSAMLRTARQFGIAIVATVAGVTVISWALALVIIPPLVISLTLFAALMPGLARRQRDVVLAEETVSHRASDLLGGLRDVLACQAGGQAAADSGAAVDGQVDAGLRLAWMQAARTVVITFGFQLPLVALIAAGPFLVGGGYVTAGALTAAASYLVITLQPALRALVRVVGTWGLQLAVVLQRLAETAADANTATPADNAAVEAPSRPIAPRSGYRLQAHGLTFRYGAHADPVLRDLDLDLDEDGHLAVVGPSGVGKSTLADLLAGLAKPGTGTITLGGLALPDWPVDRLRRGMALIPQEAYVFAGSVADNVAYLDPNASRERLDQAADAVGLAPYLRRWGGWQSGIRPVELTAGERQLIALARAYVSPAAVIILDEATCHLDPRTEDRVEHAFRDGGGTLVVIAHRISSALRADRVLALDGSAPVIGTHEEVLDQSRMYRTLVGHWSGHGESRDAGDRQPRWSVAGAHAE